MGRLDSNSILATSLYNNDPFLYAHLVKFERPLEQIIELPNGEIRYETDATRHAYITDAAYDINFNDGSTNLAGTANGSQTYRANKLLKVGSISESSAIKIASMNLQLNAAAVDASIAGTFFIDANGKLTVVSGLGFSEAGFQEGDRVKFSSGNNSTKYFKISSFPSSNVAQLSLLTLKDAAGNAVTISAEGTEGSPFSSTLFLESDEIVTLLRETLPTSFVNRSVSIYKGFMEAENPEIFIGDPILLFKGIITTATYKEDENKAIASWGLKSHWGDFQQVRGRLTSDDFHRALTPNENGQLVGNAQAAIRPEYADDKGFVHAEQAVNAIGIYMTTVTKGKMVRRGGLAGLFGGKKWKEWEEDVEREVDLRFDLQAKYLPVVYGVQRLDGNLVFADTSGGDNGASQVFIAEALCEGPIHGIYNIYVDDNSLVCVDKPDADIREDTPLNTVSDSVDVVCLGRTDKGQVMGSGSIYSAYGIDYNMYNDHSEAFTWAPALNFSVLRNIVQHRTGTSAQGGSMQVNWENRDTAFPFSPGYVGLTHDAGFGINVPTKVDVEFKAGKPDQRTSGILLTQAHSDAGFKLAKDYWGTQGSGDYWSESHQLLDTAYVVTKNTLTDEQTTVPDLEYVLKGKILECYNYDGSFAHDPTYPTVPTSGGEDAGNFTLGDIVDLKYGSTTIEDVMIIDKWIHDAGDYGGTRFRWELTAAQQTALNNAKSFYMTNGTNNWHMMTYDYQITGTVAETLVAAVGAVSGSGEADLTATIPGASALLLAAIAEGATERLRLMTLIHTTEGAPLGSTFSVTFSTPGGAHQITFNDSHSTGASATDASALLTNKIAITGSGISTVDDYYNGATVILTKVLEDGNELDITRIVEDYDGGDKLITVTEPFAPFTNDNSIKMYPENEDGKPADKITIIMGYDKRVSTNPALITYDYLTSNRYGPGIKLEDINQNSFLQAGITCDTGSDITITFPTNQTFHKNAVYKYAVGNSYKWQGTVTYESSAASLTGKTITFTNCIGKLTNKWNNWKPREIGDLIWTPGDSQIYRVSSAGIQTAFNTNTTSPSTFILAKTSGGGSNLTVPATGGNPVIYTLYDHDDVKFWKYLGWESHDQRWVTRHQANMVIRTDKPVFGNISAILEHFNGLLTYVDGKYALRVETAKDEATEGTTVFNDSNSDLNIKTRFITDEDIIGAINIKDQGLSKAYNSLSANINDPQNGFNGRAVSFFNSNYLKKDKGIVKSTSFKMPGITNYFNARMGVKQLLDQSRFNREISFTMRPSGLALTCGELIRIQYPRFGWNDGKYWRIKNLTLNENCLINIVADEYEDEVYLVPSAGESPYRINPSTEAVTRVPGAPANLSATSLAGGDEVIGQINLSWTANATNPPGIISGSYEIWRATAQDTNANVRVENYTSATHIADVKGDTLTYADVENSEGTFYYWVRAKNTLNPQTTAGKEDKNYYSAFTSFSNSGVVGTTVKIQHVKLEAQDYSVIYDVNGINPEYTGTGTNIVITATAQGYNSPEYEFTLADGTPTTFSATATYNLAIPDNISSFSIPKVVQVGVREGSSGNATQTDSISIVAVQQGPAGANAKLVVVTPATNVMFRVYDLDESNWSVVTDYEPQSITIRGSTSNTTANGVWSTSAGTLTSIDNTHTGPSCVVTAANLVDGMIVTYTLASADGSAADSTTLELIDQQEAGITILLSNETHILSASSDGAVSNPLTDSGTNIEVYSGTTRLKYDPTATDNGDTGVWKVVVGNTNNITEGTPTIGGGGTHAIISDHSSVATGTDVYVITYTISGKTQGGESFSHEKQQTLTKSKTGEDGSDSYSISMPNFGHTVPVSNAGVIDFTGSGTIIEAFRGGTELTGIAYDANNLPGANQFAVVSRTVSPAGAFDISSAPYDNSGLGGISVPGGSDKHLVVADFDEMSATEDVGTVIYTLNLGNVAGQTARTINQSITKAISGTIGSAGADAKTVHLTAVDYSIVYNESGASPDPAAGNMTLTATSQNFTDPYFKFTGDGVASPDSAYTNGASGDNADTHNFTVPSTYFSSPKTVRVGVAEAAADTTEIAFDTITITAVKPGSTGPAGVDGMTFVLTNASHVFPASGTGAVSSYSNSGTIIEVYEGSTELSYDGAGTSNSTWKTTEATTNITLGSKTDNGDSLTVGNHTGVADGTDTSEIVYTISGKRADGTAFSTTAKQTFTKSKEGEDGQGTKYASIYNLNDNSLASNTSGTYATPLATDNSNDGWTISPPGLAANNDIVYVSTRTFTSDGESPATATWTAPVIHSRRTDGATGAAGEAAYTVSLTANKYAIAYNIDGGESDSLTFTATPQGIQGTATYKFEVDGTEKQAASTTATYAMADGDEPISGDAKVVKVTMYDDTVLKATDSVSIYGIQDGADAITAVMTNEAHALPTTAAGTVTYTNSGTDIKVFLGSTQLNYHASNASTFSVAASASNITAGGASTVSSNIRRYADHSSITAATATITYTITVRNALGTATTITKIQTLNKTTDGDPGDDGKQLAEIELYYPLAAGSYTLPSTAPTSGTYNFGTGVVAATITSGWSQTKPAIEAGRISALSKTLATEATAGGGVSGSLTWSTPVIYAGGAPILDYIFKYESSAPSAPADTTYPALPSGWTTSIPTNPNDGKKLYSSKGFAQLSGSFPNFSFSYDWALPVVHTQTWSDIAGSTNAPDNSATNNETSSGTTTERNSTTGTEGDFFFDETEFELYVWVGS